MCIGLTCITLNDNKDLQQQLTSPLTIKLDNVAINDVLPLKAARRDDIDIESQ